MIAKVSAHRRANAFAQALEEQPPGDEAAAQPGEAAGPAAHGPLLALANGLGELPRPEMDPEVKVVQRAQLLAAMETMFAEGGAPADPTVPEQRKKSPRRSSLRRLRPRSRWSKGIAAGGLTVGVAAGAFGGVAAASSDALPGDSLYGLKRGMEDIHLGMARNGTDRGEVYLDQASTRLSEARRLMERARSGHLDHEQLGEIRRTLNGMTHDASEGHRLLREAYQRDGTIGPIRTLDSFSRSHRETWSSLRDRLPLQLTDVGEQVSSVFDAIDEEVGPLQSLLPRTPDRSDDAKRSHAEEHGASPSRTDHATPSSPGTPHGHTDDSTTPHPSGGPDNSPSGGLLTGGTDGLLGTPPSGTDPSTGGRVGPSSPPAVTLPPLLPGLLPGLGINNDHANE